ncbi:MAG: exodeoxyribonuclease VII small subunit [Pseudomonadota bacterium]
MPRKKATAKPTGEHIDFEQALRELESLVEELETREFPLEESLKHFERGVTLTRICQTALTAAEQKVRVLTEKEGRVSLEPLDVLDKKGSNG